MCARGLASCAAGSGEEAVGPCFTRLFSLRWGGDTFLAFRWTLEWCFLNPSAERKRLSHLLQGCSMQTMHKSSQTPSHLICNGSGQSSNGLRGRSNNIMLNSLTKLLYACAGPGD